MHGDFGTGAGRAAADGSAAAGLNGVSGTARVSDGLPLGGDAAPGHSGYGAGGHGGGGTGGQAGSGPLSDPTDGGAGIVMVVY